MKDKISIMLNNKKIVIIGLILWGIFCGWLLTQRYAYTIGNGYIDDYRADRLTAKYQFLLENGHPFDGVTGIQGNGYYYPYLMKLFHIEDGFIMWYFAQALSGAAAIAVYPLIMYLLMDSLSVALISPFVAHLTFGDMLYMNKGGIYFGMLWIVAIGTPFVLLILKSDNQRSIIVLAIILSALVSISNIMRTNAGFPIFFASIIALLYKFIRKKVSAIAVICLLTILIVNYGMLINGAHFVMERKYGVFERNSYPWHAMLIGLGYIDNDYGLAYSDDVAYNMVERLYPGVESGNEEYFDKCKDIYFTIIRQDPGFAVKCYLAKFRDGVLRQMKYVIGGYDESEYSKIPFIIFLIVFLVILCKKKEWDYIKTFFVIAIVCYAISLLAMVQGMVAIPVLYYIYGTAGGAGVTIAISFLYACRVVLNHIRVNHDELPSGVV